VGSGEGKIWRKRLVGVPYSVLSGYTHLVLNGCIPGERASPSLPFNTFGMGVYQKWERRAKESRQTPSNM